MIKGICWSSNARESFAAKILIFSFINCRKFFFNCRDSRGNIITHNPRNADVIAYKNKIGHINEFIIVGM